jgi:hypothetical protein
MPAIIARNYLRNKYYALRLSKTAVLINAVAMVECYPPPLPTIYLYGPDLMGEREAVERSGFFMEFPQDWNKTNGHGWSGEHLGLNKAKTSELLRTYESYDWLQEAAKRIDSLPTEEIIRIAYDFVFSRPTPNGSMKVMGLEAFSKTAVNTLCRNFMRANQNNLLRDGLGCTPDGSVTVQEIENNLNEGGFSNQDCLKIGPTNNLLTYLAIHFLNMYGWKANIRSLSYLLACQYLRSVTKLRTLEKNLKEASSYNQELAIKSQIESEMKNKERLEKFAFKFVRKSVASLIEQNAIADVGNAYLTLGAVVETPFGIVTMDPYHYNNLYSSTLQNIRELHRLTEKKGVSAAHATRPQPQVLHKPKVYLASTCQDFRDLRREVALSLREWGCQPILNEDSDFPVKVGVSSYQACVEAVKQSDCLVLIIGTRYGEEVENKGISVTELEYRTACDNGIPRINFCLESVWNLIPVKRKNPNMEYPEYFHEKKDKVDKIFRFLDYVKKYESGKTDNWVHPFRDSVELKEILRKRLINAGIIRRS